LGRVAGASPPFGGGPGHPPPPPPKDRTLPPEVGTFLNTYFEIETLVPNY
jgi:hypothetical protein